jgi:hypothetical protein
MHHIQAGWFNVLTCINEKCASVSGVGFETTFLGSEKYKTVNTIDCMVTSTHSRTLSWVVWIHSTIWSAEDLCWYFPLIYAFFSQVASSFSFLTKIMYVSYVMCAHSFVYVVQFMLVFVYRWKCLKERMLISSYLKKSGWSLWRALS